MIRKKIVILSVIAPILSCTGCGAIQYGTDDLPESSFTYQKNAEDTAKDIIKNKAQEKHESLELSDEFVSKYLDVDSFEELKKRTQEGIAATSNEAGMTKKEILLWQDLIKKKLAMQYTSPDYETKKDELENSLDQMAADHCMSREKFYKKYYDMTNTDTEAFVEKQAKKLTESSDIISNSEQESGEK